MNAIRFSHEYPKLWGQTRARLLAVLPLHVEGGINTKLREYDTKTVDGEYYPIPDGDYLQLVFIGDEGIPFCTIRRQTMDKVRFYNDRIGQSFDIEIKE